MRRTLVVLGVAVFALLAIGFVTLASAGTVNAARQYHGDVYAYLNRQAIALAVALVAGCAMALFDYRQWRARTWLLVAVYAVVAVMLAMLLPKIAPLFGFKGINGSYRWIDIPGIGQRLQPTELAKIVLILSLGVYIDRLGAGVSLFCKGLLPMLGMVGLYMGLTFFEPDLGSAAVMGGVAFVLFLVSGVKISHLAICMVGGAAAFAGVISFLPNRLIRLAPHMPHSIGAWMVEFYGLPASALVEKNSKTLYQLNQSLVAFGNAYQSNLHPFWDPSHLYPWWNAWTGVGYNESMQKRAYLPEAHTDFIFAIGAEEMGLIFSLVVLALFAIVFTCGILIALRAEDRLGRLFAYGATFLLCAQAFANMGVVSGVLPTKGLALPFLSYGGSNLVSACVCAGLIFNVGLRVGRAQSKKRIAMHLPKE